MSLQSNVEADYKKAFKASDRLVVSSLRMLKSAFKNQEIEVGRELTDEETVAVVAREQKRRRDAAAQYEAGGRHDLANKERAEMAVYQKYMPEQLSEEALRGLIKEAAARVGATGPNDMGKVMGAVMGGVKGRADGSVVQALVREILAG